MSLDPFHSVRSDSAACDCAHYSIKAVERVLLICPEKRISSSVIKASVENELGNSCCDLQKKIYIYIYTALNF